MLKKFISFLLPWSLRRKLLISWFGYEIHPTAKIGWAWVFPQKLVMKERSKIGHLTVGVHLDYIELGMNASIGRSNWITGFPGSANSKHFAHQIGQREPKLIVGDHSAVTKQHHLDCTNSIVIGRFVTIAGYQSQFLTHSIDIYHNRQDSSPISIGDYCFIGTNVTVLGGSKLPAYSVLGAKSLLNKAYDDEWGLYAGVPTKFVKHLDKTYKYFTREEGFVF
ncbi:acyltransferase [Parapedobacter tibetensis]|uniref:acyltransferase n=1 Tax=Parapedobacter tibetensis TaxID=2972951 RepID=UPI00214D5A02|nr:hypothetical protein [Parapedobacter tibetensis]